jgi:hypothetical protein
MASCYICGKQIPHGQEQRRDVRTGGSTRIYWGRRTRVSTQQSHGLRTVCPECAKAKDAANARGCLVLLVIVIAIAIVLLFRHSSQ